MKKPRSDGWIGLKFPALLGSFSLIQWTVTFVSHGRIQDLHSRDAKLWHSASKCWGKYGNPTPTSSMDANPICIPSLHPISLWGFFPTERSCIHNGKLFSPYLMSISTTLIYQISLPVRLPNFEKQPWLMFCNYFWPVKIISIDWLDSWFYFV